MATASSSTLVRWRPAILTVTVLSAGFALYHLRGGLQLSREESQPQLHRSNAIHRRSRQHGRGRSTTAPVNQTVNISAQELMQMFLEGSDTFAYDEHTIWHPGQEEHISISRSNLRTLSQTLESLEPEEVEKLRATFEETLVVTFLCTRMPVNAVLRDPEGQPAFLRAFQNEGFDRLTTVSRVLTAWNLGKFDEAPERLRFYERLHVPSSATRNFLQRPPEGDEEDLLLDQSDPQRSRERQEEPIMTSESEEDDNDDDRSEVSWRHEDEEGGNTDEGKKEGQTLLNMLYHIAEEQSKQYGYVHRGVSCNSCNMLPIRGIRYRCSNCPDYDLCEQCEAMQVHPKTHLLYKIRVPAPFFDNSQRPQAPRYPGKLHGLPNHLPRQVSKQLSQQSGRELAEIEALWDTFKCLATVEWPSDPLEFGVAIDRDCFDLCFLASTSTSRKPPNLPMHDRIFAFFDANKDNLIGFEEFITGIATIRTKDRNLRLKRTFWVYDFDEDGYVCRNDFLFMFRSYYALSKELTLDMIKNMEYDVLEGPNPQDIILGTQPISAAYNGAIPQPHSRKRQEGKDVNFEGERVISDGGGVITEHDSDLADYWDIIADASEKAVFGYVMDLDSMEPFRHMASQPGAASDDHVLLNKDWCPSFVMQEDIETALGTRKTPNEVTETSDRRKCIETAIQRRHDVRRLGVQRRKERSSFYDPRPAKLAPSTELPNGNIEPASNGMPTLQSSTSIQKTPAKRVPPPLEDDVGQEFLFQMLQEGLNELLDPLFRQREELAIEARKTRVLRNRIRDKLDAYATPIMRKLCAHQINTLEILSKAYHERDALDPGVNIGQELRKIISLQDNEYSDEYVRNLKTMLELGVIEEDEYKRRMQSSKVANPPTDDEDGSDGKVSPLNEREDGESPKLEGVERIVYPAEELDRLIHEINDLAPLQRAPSSTAPRGNEADVQPSHQETISEISEAPASSHHDVPVFSAPSDETVAAQSSSIQTQLLQSAQEFDAAFEQFIASEPLEELLSHSGYTTIDPPRRTTADPFIPRIETPTPQGLNQEGQEEPRDPTLPQHRPNSDADMVNGSPTWPNKLPELAYELTQREPTQQELKYYLMLECLEAEDKKRGGPGRLNFEEFEAIMNGPRGNRLNFTGMFFEMVNF
jgi:Zinc finger, ZZ type